MDSRTISKGKGLRKTGKCGKAKIYAGNRELAKLEKVLEQYHKKNTKKIYNTITKPCKKLIQKCSYRSISDTSSLCSFTYWLYIYGDKEPALEICEKG